MKPYDASYLLALLLPDVCVIAVPPISLPSLGQSPANPFLINSTIYANDTTLPSLLQNTTKALFPPPDPLTWDTPNMSLNFRDYIYNSVYNYTDTKATILAAMNAAAMISPQTVFPPGTYRWEVGVTTLDCFIGTHGSRGYSTYGEWMESLNAMSLFNRNYKMISFAVDLYVRRTDTQGRTRLYEQGDCYLVV